MQSNILERLARVIPPRLGQQNNSQPWYAFACNTATTAQAITTIPVTQRTGTDSFGNAITSLPGVVSRQLLRVQAEGNDLWILFGPTNAVQANSVTVGTNAAMHLPVNQERDFEIDTAVDKYLSAVTQNNSALTATCRIGIVSSYVTTAQGI